MINICLIFFIISFSNSNVVHPASVGDYKSYENYKVYEVQGSIDGAKKMLEIMRNFDNDLVYGSNGNATQVLVTPELSRVFEEITKREGLETQLVVDDYSQVITEERVVPQQHRGEFSWYAYYDVDDIYSYLENMSKTYSNWTKLVVGGQSYEGRQILGLRINTPVGREAKPVIFIESGIHAREWITPATTTYFINQLLTNSDPSIMDLRDSFDWHIFPTVNPDGYQYSRTFNRMWRKTRSKSSNGCYGADPNRNWDYNWLQNGATDDPCDFQTYGGAQPFSEIETQTLSSYIASLENLQGYIAFHSDAQMLLVPYSDSEEHYDNYKDLVDIGTTSLDYGYKVNGAKYKGPATAAEVLYKASGGSMDWVRHALGTPLAYTYELRGTYFHWPAWRIPEQGEEVTQMMLGLVTQATQLGYF